MKLNIKIAIVALAGFALVSCNEGSTDNSAAPSSPANETAASPANAQTVSLKVTGMT